MALGVLPLAWTTSFVKLFKSNPDNADKGVAIPSPAPIYWPFKVCDVLRPDFDPVVLKVPLDLLTILSGCYSFV